MRNYTIKMEKGGLDSIIAFVVVLLPLVYILIYMVATLYHFGVQMYMNQVVKETLVMASTYGTVTESMHNQLYNKVSEVAGHVEIEYYYRDFDNGNGIVGAMQILARAPFSFPLSQLGEADLLGIYVQSSEPSLLGTVSNFNFFMTQGSSSDLLKYSAYREEIIRNDDYTTP